MRANFAAPTIVLKEGQRVYLDLSNVGMLMRPDLFDPHTVHFHGFPQAAAIFDGEPMASVSINMGGTLRYFYQIEQPGTYLYHCHVEATEHMEMGMIGNLWVEPKQNNTGYPDVNNPGTMIGAGQKYAYNDGDGSTRYDVDYPVQLLGFDRGYHEEHIAVQPLPFWSLDESYPMINGRGYPDTVNPGPIANGNGDESQKVSSLINATIGQKILLRISNVSISDFHTLTVLGIPMRVVGKDARLLRGPTGLDLSYQTTAITLGGGESAYAILDTTGLNPGTYFIYDSRLSHLSNDQEDYGGMMTEIHLAAPAAIAGAPGGVVGDAGLKPAIRQVENLRYQEAAVQAAQ
jgi:FtsP/CotA-like multicopper oxidase with cupredoxin domain